MKIFKGCQKVAGRGLISWFIKSKKCPNTRKNGVSGVLFGNRQLPIFPANATAVRKGRAASPQERHPSAPLLTGLPPRCIPHRGRSAPPHRQPLAAAPSPEKILCSPIPKGNTLHSRVFPFGIRQLPIFPGRRQPSIVGV